MSVQVIQVTDMHVTINILKDEISNWAVFCYLLWRLLFLALLNTVALHATFAFGVTRECTPRSRPAHFEMFQTEDKPIIILVCRGLA